MTGQSTKASDRKGSSRSAKKRKQNKNAFKDLKAMPCFDQMADKIKAGVSVETVAEWLQEDMFQQVDIQRESLVRKLFRFKASLPPGDLAKVEPLYIQTAIEKMKRGVKELDELEKLYLLQLQRISRDANTEEKIGKLFKGTANEIKLAVDILRDMVALKQDLGILSKAADSLNVAGSLDLNGHVSVEVDEEAKLRMGLLAGKILHEASKRVVEAAVETKEEDKLG